MPQQLIYTSAPRGITAGRSGHCTVARSAAMREALALQLEKLSYYQHLSLSGGQERPIYSCRVVEIRGSRYHVLSRIQDAGLDFTGRTNFLAHHLTFTPEEIRQLPSPPIILRGWPGWATAWQGEARLLEDEDWSGLAELSGNAFVPATHWEQVTGDAGNGYALLESRGALTVRVDNLTEAQILGLFAEALELLEVRDPHHDFRASAWQYTFTTSMQEQDNPADFRWRCLHSDNPASNAYAEPDCRPLSELRSSRASRDEILFARSGRQPPRQVVLSSDKLEIEEGAELILQVTTDGIPAPTIRWFEIELRKRKDLPGVGGRTLTLKPEGRAKRYQVEACNKAGSAESNILEISIRAPIRAPNHPPQSAPTIRRDFGKAKSLRSYEAINQDFSANLQKQRAKSPLFRISVITAACLAISALAWLTIQQFNSKKIIVTGLSTNGVSATPKAGGSDSRTGISRFDKTTQNHANVAAVSSNPIGAAMQQGTFTDNIPPWEKSGIGNVQAKTSAFKEGDGFILNGAGENIYGKSDNFFFVHQKASNSVDFVVRLRKVDEGNTARAGIMIRDSKKPDGAFAFIGLSQTRVFWLHRDKPSTPCTSASTPSRPAPVFLKLRRITNLVLGGFSDDGKNWTWLGTNWIELPDQGSLIGFALSSGDGNKPVQAQFDNVEIEGEKQ